MKLSTASHYGLRAIVSLAQKGGRSVKDISAEENIPFEYLEKIFSKLKRADIVGVKRGVQGGYFLNRTSDHISVGQIISTLEGILSPVNCVAAKKQQTCCSKSKNCPTQKVWQTINNNLTSTLNAITLSNLINSNAE